jgi:hypothetical protein
MNYEDKQRSYYVNEINRALPGTQRVDVEAIETALRTTDSDVPGAPVAAHSFVAQMSNTNAAARDAECRALPYPGSGMRDPAARTGCGWWFVPDKAKQSVGAYGTRRGAMNPTLDSAIGPGKWMWDPRDAQQAEAIKKASQITSCPDIQYSAIPNMGWCPSTGMAVMTDGAGNPLYPQAAGGDCPGGGIIMTAAGCSSGGGAGAGGAGGAGAGGAAAGGASISSLCTPQPNGALPPTCLQAIASSSCSSAGTLAQSLGAGYAGSNPTFNATNRYLLDRGFTLNSGIINDGQLSIADAFSSIQGLRGMAGAGDGSRATSAAANLCYGAAFDPCALSASDTGPYDPNCVNQAALALGYAASGTALQAQTAANTAIMQLPNWGAVMAQLQALKTAADTPSSDPQQQLAAILQVYGVNLQFPPTVCPTPA